MELFTTTFTLGQIITALFILYVAVVLVVILLDNRTPQSTFAWLFLIIVFPVIGLIIYLFTGRGSKAFSNESRLARMGGLVTPYGTVIDPLLKSQAAYIEKVRTEKPESYRERLLQLVQRDTPSLITAYNRVEILQNATEKYPRLMQDIRGAQSSIHLLYYIWTEDEFTIELKDALIERALAGVKVHALIDESNFLVSKQYVEELRQAGVKLFPYRVFKSLARLHTANYRSHRKIVVVDGKIGYVGGMNLDKEQLPGNNKLGDWRDTHLRIEGEAALALQASFVVSWFNTTNEKLSDPMYFPKVEPGSLPFTPVQITPGGPDSQWKAMQQLYFFMIMNANKKVQIQSPFFIPDVSLLEAIKAAALSGVEVEIMCTWRGAVFEMPYRAAYTYFADVVKAGARVYVYKKGYFHAKTINIDSQVCAIGTANFDIRSFYLNYEMMGVVYDEAIAGELAADFQNDKRFCEEFTLEEYNNSPVWRRLLDSIWRLASPVL